MNKLLNKPFKAFTVYALIILACSIPVYYFVVDAIWLNELDEHNYMVKERIQKGMSDISLDENDLKTLLLNWSKLQPGSTLALTNLSAAKPDSAYTISRPNVFAANEETDRFRGLSSYIRRSGKTYRLQIETNIEEAHETIFAITIVTLLFFALLVVGFIVLNRRIASKIWKPFRNTLEKLKSFDLTELQSISFEKSGIEEFEELNLSLAKLLDKNIAVYIQQKTFIENASHELQTPLAVLKSKMELLLQNKSMTGEQSEILAAIELPLSRMSRINKNLLLLAKIENNQFAGKEMIELASVIDETLELLFDYTAAKQIAISKSFSQKLHVTANKTLIEILITNLLINAIVHNVEQGKVQVCLSGKTLTVLNSGNAGLQSEKLFQRFTISSAEATNSGLGLSIVKEICNRYNWSVAYVFQNNLHAFSVTF